MNNKIIYAGGGLVRNAAGDFLMIYRNGRWDLPKGKQEVGEAIETCALREVCEECGLDLGELRLGRFLVETSHNYRQNGELLLKRTSWFAMEYGGSGLLVPQVIEGITRAEWVAAEAVAALLEGSYPTISEVFAAL